MYDIIFIFIDELYFKRTTTKIIHVEDPLMFLTFSNTNIKNTIHSYGM